MIDALIQWIVALMTSLFSAFTGLTGGDLEPGLSMLLPGEP